MTHIDRARLQHLGIDPAQVTVTPDDLAARVAKVMEMQGRGVWNTSYNEGYEDALADVRATLRGEL